MADINTKYTYVLEALRADGKKVMRFTNKPENRAQVLINNGYKPVDETITAIIWISVGTYLVLSEKDSSTKDI